MIALAAEDLADLRRWAISGAIVVFAYGGIAAAMVNWHDPVDPAEPAGAIVIELAPEQVAAPEQVQSDAVPDKPIEKVEEKPEEKIEAKGEEKIEEKVEPKPREEQPRDAVAVTTPPPPELPKVAALPAGPVQGPLSKPIDSKAVQAWMGQLSSLLERHKRYPAAALSGREQGTAQVFFSLDRQGRVIESRIVRSSGAAALDEEALALVRRVQPFPVWPREQFAGDHLDLTVPIRFSLK
jgi:periplasmic protein TonB